MLRLLVATTNQGKLREVREILTGLSVEILTLEAGVEAPEETGDTFEANARQKAEYYARLKPGATPNRTAIPIPAGSPVFTVAEDSGLEIDALGGAPGVQSARYGGVESTYPERFARLYEALRARGSVESPARFVCALAVSDGARIVFEARGTVEGRIAPAPRGTGGFGYDPIFYYPPFGTTLAESGDRKSEVSHRGQAFRQLRDWLRTQEPGLGARGSSL